jgi:hypothetical protein
MGFRSTGQVGEVFSAEIRQSAQKVWPHGVSKAHQSTPRQMGQRTHGSIGAVGVQLRISENLAIGLCWALDLRSYQATIPSGVLIVRGQWGIISSEVEGGKK